VTGNEIPLTDATQDILPEHASEPAAPEPVVHEYGEANLAIPEHAAALAIPEHAHELAIPEHTHELAIPEHVPEPPIHEREPELAITEPVVDLVIPEPAPVFDRPEAAENLAAQVPQPPAEPVAETSAAVPPAKGAPRTVGFDPSVEERKQRAEQQWKNVVASRESGETLYGTVTTAVKGGLLVDVGGVRGFLPASQTRPEAGTTLESLVKTKVPLRVIDIDEKRRRIVVSQRRALDDLRRAKRNEFLRSLRIGQLHEGSVVRLAPFGAFVDIGGIEGLVPMSELAFERVDKVEDVLKVGERVAVSVLRIEEGGKKIGLSRKNALPDPLRDHAALLRPGTVVEGKVVAKDPRLQVEIAPGLVGSVRESDADPAEYEIGEAIEVAVRYVDRRTRRVVLTTMHGAAAVAPRSTGFAPLGEELRRRN
jgi:small subunit ribosomal protein S1